jgi:hypothetical protein
MDQDRPTPAGFGTQTGSDFGRTGTGSGTDTGTCERCGQPLGGHNRAIEQFLGKLGINDEMINTLKSQIGNVDVEEYLNTAKEYLRTAGEKVKPATEKAKAYSKENPGKVAAGVAILALGAGLLINSMRER